MCRINASLLECCIDCFFNHFFLGFLDSYLEFLILYRLWNRSFIKCNRLHCSHLHGNLVSGVLVVGAELNHCCQSVAAHVVVNRDVVSLKEVVAIYLHLLSGDTRTVLNSCCSVVTISQLERFNFVKRLAFCSNCRIKNILSELYEVLTGSHKVGLTLHSNHCCETWNTLNEYATVRSFTVRTLCSNSQTTITEQVFRLVEIAFSLCKSLLYVSQTSTGHTAKLLDIFY